MRVLAFAAWVRFPTGWNGVFHLWRLPGESLGRGCNFFDRLILPGSRALGAGLPGIRGSWSLELLPPSRSGCMQLRCRSCSSHPSTCLFFLAKTSASRVLTVSSAHDSERVITFGSFSLLGIALRPRLLLTKLARWSGGSGAWVPGYLVSLALGLSSYCLRHVQVACSSAAAPVHHTLRHACFSSRKLRLRGC